ncbi:unnamed protein product [Paramecium pentaurelia]|uniref:WD40-repeat-containing domain n=1 Tax=Paramecium pentaurelia TaxID=43138 RepID=A0A8S1TH43_9CILI|nr:unnamed protein product [Paramecium pentaurelia]
MQTVSEQTLRKDYKIKVDEIIQNFEQALDVKQIINQYKQSSFNRIDAQLDEILNDKFYLIQIQPSQLSSDLPKVNSNSLLKLKNDDFQKQINQEVTSLIKSNIQQVLQKKEQQYQYLYKEAQTKWEQKIQEKDYQIQQLNNSQTIQQPSTFISNQSNFKPFTYQFIQQNSIKQDQYCYAIAVNKDCSIVVAGGEKQIKVFEFQQEILKQVQLLSEHGSSVVTLNFMKRSDQFISGSDDKQIIIWTRYQHNSWICSQKLNGHTDQIRCLIINNNEDLIVSGSKDKTIKFWQKQNEWLCSQTITDHTNYVWGLCQNEQQNRVISCGDDKLILIMEQQNKQWIVIQKITVEIEGLRLCFIDNNTFTFQPWQKEYMHVFEINSTNKQYTKTKDIPIEICFLNNIQNKNCILVNKNASNVSLMRKKQNGEFIIEQSIDFGTQYIFGYMTDDGQYLITWDDKSKEYQIRKYQEQ